MFYRTGRQQHFIVMYVHTQRWQIKKSCIFVPFCIIFFLYSFFLYFVHPFLPFIFFLSSFFSLLFIFSFSSFRLHSFLHCSHLSLLCLFLLVLPPFPLSDLSCLWADDDLWIHSFQSGLWDWIMFTWSSSSFSPLCQISEFLHPEVLFVLVNVVHKRHLPLKLSVSWRKCPYKQNHSKRLIIFLVLRYELRSQAMRPVTRVFVWSADWCREALIKTQILHRKVQMDLLFCKSFF